MHCFKRQPWSSGCQLGLANRECQELLRERRMRSWRLFPPFLSAVGSPSLCPSTESPAPAREPTQLLWLPPLPPVGLG